MFLTMTTRKLKITYVACIPSLLALLHSIHLFFFFFLRLEILLHILFKMYLFILNGR